MLDWRHGLPLESLSAMFLLIICIGNKPTLHMEMLFLASNFLATLRSPSNETCLKSREGDAANFSNGMPENRTSIC